MSKVTRIVWDGEVTVFFDGSPEPWSEQEFKEGSDTQRLFHHLDGFLHGVTAAYEEAYDPQKDRIGD